MMKSIPNELRFERDLSTLFIVALYFLFGIRITNSRAWNIPCEVSANLFVSLPRNIRCATHGRFLDQFQHLTDPKPGAGHFAHLILPWKFNTERNLFQFISTGTPTLTSQGSVNTQIIHPPSLGPSGNGLRTTANHPTCLPVTEIPPPHFTSTPTPTMELQWPWNVPLFIRSHPKTSYSRFRTCTNVPTHSV